MDMSFGEHRSWCIEVTGREPFDVSIMAAGEIVATCRNREYQVFGLDGQSLRQVSREEAYESIDDHTCALFALIESRTNYDDCRAIVADERAQEAVARGKQRRKKFYRPLSR